MVANGPPASTLPEPVDGVLRAKTGQSTSGQSTSGQPTSGQPTSRRSTSTRSTTAEPEPVDQAGNTDHAEVGNPAGAGLANRSWEALFRAQVTLMRVFSAEDIWKPVSMREYDVL